MNANYIFFATLEFNSKNDVRTPEIHFLKTNRINNLKNRLIQQYFA